MFLLYFYETYFTVASGPNLYHGLGFGKLSLISVPIRSFFVVILKAGFLCFLFLYFFPLILLFIFLVCRKRTLLLLYKRTLCTRLVPTCKNRYSVSMIWATSRFQTLWMLGKLCRNVNKLLGEATTDPFLEILELSAFDILYAILEYCHI